MSEGRIFINYRRGDSQGSAGRIFDRLQQHFERDKIFIDVDAIEPGVDFVQSLDKQVSTCSAFLAVIGPGWLDARNGAGQRRLDDPSDYVRVEIESALKRDIRVIPVLVDGASMPSPSALPASLEPLSRRNAVEITHHRFAADCDELAVAIKRALGMTAPATSVAQPHPTSAVAQPVADRDLTPKILQAKLSWPEILLSFRGRISRSQFAIGVLVVYGIVFAFYFSLGFATDQLFSASDEQAQTALKALRDLLDKRLLALLEVIVFWPSCALTLKRLHDIGQGWMALLVIVGLDVISTVCDLLDYDDLSNTVMLFYGGIILMITVIKGTPGPNRYGPDPLPPATTA